MINQKFCPKCKSEEVDLVAGGTMGTWICKNCGYSGSFFPEKDIVGKSGKVKIEDEELK